MAFKIASSPHLTQHVQTNVIMQRVLLCALPGIAVQSIFFGYGSIIQVLLAITVALIAEACVLKLRSRPVIPTLKDNSAVLTAVLLGIAIPPLAPWWVVVIGTAFAIIVVKHLYGGLGQNIFNPAMAAYVLLLISFPVQMTSWLAPITAAQMTPDIATSAQIIFQATQLEVSHLYQLNVDGTTMATPLNTVKTDLSLGLTTTQSLDNAIFSHGIARGWFWVNLAYLAGGLMMLKLKLIRWEISGAVLLSLFFFSGSAYLISPDNHISPFLHLFTGATMLGAFFIATDPVTAPSSNRGRIIFGLMIGLIVFLIRSYGGYPDAFAFAILLTNIAVPMIDYYLKPRTYGHQLHRRGDD